MTALEVFAAQNADIPDLLNLYTHLNPDDAPILAEQAGARLQAISAIGDSAILVGRYDGQAVCSCTLLVLPNLSRHGLPFALIENVVTHPDHRGRGYGTKILHDARDRAFSAGCYKVMLMTGSKRKETLEFYQNAGFKQDKTGFQIRNLPPRVE